MKHYDFSVLTLVFTLFVYCSAAMGAEACISSNNGFRPKDPTLSQARPGSSIFIFSKPPVSAAPFEILNGLASVRARVCVFQYSNSVQVSLKSSGLSKVITVGPSSCVDAYVPATTILKECEASKGCEPLPLEYWCVNGKDEPIRLAWKGHVFLKGYYIRDYVSADASKLLTLSAVFSVTSKSEDLNVLVASTRTERVEVCTEIGTVIAISDQVLASSVTQKFTSTHRCTVVEGRTIWIEKPADSSLLPLKGAYRLIPRST